MRNFFKRLYRAFPFKKEIFTFIRFFWSPSHAVYQHLHFRGVIRVRVHNTSSFFIRHHGQQIENHLFWKGLYGAWEKDSMRLWIRLCRHAKVILDIGANTGIYALSAKSVNPGSAVYAFEPVERVVEKLKENIRLNKYDIHVSDKAVSDRDGSAVIFDTDAEHTLSVTVNKNLLPEGVKAIQTEIQTIRLDTFIREKNIPKIDLIKIDVETHEPEALTGYGEYLAIHRPALLIEVLNEEIGKKVEEQTNGLGYLYFNISENGSVRQEHHITKSDRFNYLLCNEATAIQLGLLPNLPS